MTALRTKNSTRRDSSGEKSRYSSMLAVAVLLLAAAALLIWRAIAVNEQIAAQHDRLVAEVVRGTAAAISSHLHTLQRGVALLAEDNAALIGELAADPANEDLHEVLDGKISRAFPEAFAFTLADSDGAPLLEDFEGLVGEICREEIRHRALKSQVPEPVVHPNPLGYHFDIMHSLELEEGDRGIFFVSIHAESLAENLANHSLPGYLLFVVNREILDLIEVGAEGGRDALAREIRLSPEELRRIAHRLPLNGTRWDIVALRQDAAASAGAQLWQQTLWALGILGIIGGAALLIIRRSQQLVAFAALRADDQHKRLQTIVETVAEAIVTIDKRGVILTFNPAAEGIFAYNAAEVVGQNVRMLMPEPYHSEHDGYLARYLTTGEARVIGTGVGREVTGRRKDGSTFPMELAVNDSTAGSQRLFTGAIRDITERKEVDRMKNEFISLVSHELRTPLTSIRGSLGLILGGAAGEIPPQAKQLIKIAANNSERLVRLINDVLDIEKIESGKIQFEMKPQPLLPLIEQAIESNHGFATQHGVVIELAPDATDVSAKIDADRITQVLVNLLSNAVKFSPPEGKVQVAAERTEAGVRVAVVDSGPGIPEEFRGRIFKKFAQADSSDTRQKGGTGLGLSISKAIVREHGGEIGFDLEAGQGSTFWFELPTIADAPAIVVPLHGQPPPARGARLLVCEDDPDVANLIRLMLEQSGYRADVVHDVPQARRMIAETHYDAVTMDLALPGEDGLSFIRELQSSDSTHDLPIVVLSAKADQGKEELAGAAVGVIDWLGKPIDEIRLRAAVRRATGGSLPKILHVEDDRELAQVVASIIGEESRISHAESLRAAKEGLRRERFDLVILDLDLPDGSGLSLLPLINSAESPPPILVFSAHALSPDEAQEVSVALVKSQIDNFELLKTVNALLNSRGRGGRKESQAETEGR